MSKLGVKYKKLHQKWYVYGLDGALDSFDTEEEANDFYFGEPLVLQSPVEGEEWPPTDGFFTE